MSLNTPATDNDSFFVSYRKGPSALEGEEPTEEVAEEMRDLPYERNETVLPEPPPVIEEVAIPECAVDTGEVVDHATQESDVLSVDAPLVEDVAEDQALAEPDILQVHEPSQDVVTASNDDSTDAPAQPYLPKILDKIDQLEFVIVEGREVTDFLLDKVAHLSQGIDALAVQESHTTPEPATQATDSAVCDRLDRVEGRMDALFAAIQSVADQLQVTKASGEPERQTVAALEQLEVVQKVAQQSDETSAILETLQGQVADIAARQDQIAEVVSSMDDKIAQNDAASTKPMDADALVSKVAEAVIIALPIPAQDDPSNLAEIARDMLMQAGSAISNAHATAIEHILQTNTAPSSEPQFEKLSTQLDEIAERLENQQNSGLSAQDVAGQVADTVLNGLCPTLEGHADTVRQTVDLMAMRPDPVIDMTAQRRSFAQFSTVLARVVERLEKVTEQVSGTETEGPAAVQSALHESISGLSEQHTIEITDLRTWLTDTLASFEPAQAPPELPPIGERLDRLASEIAAVAQRPDPVLDLTAQHRGFAQFNAAASKVLQQFEKSAQEINADVHDLKKTMSDQANATEPPEDGPTTATLADAINIIASTNNELAKAGTSAVLAGGLEAEMRELRQTLAEFLARLVHQFDVPVAGVAQDGSDCS